MHGKFSKFDSGYREKSYVRKFKAFGHGFVFILGRDLRVTYKIALSLLVLVLAFFWQTQVEVFLVLLASSQMVSMEILNSAVELLCDLYDSNYNEKIKIIKDVSAAATVISTLVWLIVLGYEVYMLWWG